VAPVSDGPVSDGPVREPPSTTAPPPLEDGATSPTGSPARVAARPGLRSTGTRWSMASFASASAAEFAARGIHM
jgi:hypothetical protein